MLKILFVQKEGGIFGAENYQLKVIPGLMLRGVKLEFLRLYTDHQGGVGGDFIDRLTGLGVKTHEVNIGKYPTWSVLNKIKHIANDGKFDIVHTHLIHADFHLALIKTFMRLRPVLVSTKHGYDNAFTSKYGFDADKQTRTPYYLISRWSEKRMKASFTISNGLRDFFISTGLSSIEKMSLIHYGFDMPNHFESKGRGEFRMSPKQLIIAGRLIGFKGHKYLIDAMPAIVDKFGAEVKLIVAGTGNLESDLKSRVDKLNLKNNVVFLGYSKEVGQYMANSDVVVIPSISEGFGVVFLEAFAAKTPVVSWDVPAGNELLEHENTGYLVKPYEVDRLASQLIAALEYPSESIVNNAYARLTSYFNGKRMIEETIIFYQSAIDS